MFWHSVKFWIYFIATVLLLNTFLVFLWYALGFKMFLLGIISLSSQGRKLFGLIGSHQGHVGCNGETRAKLQTFWLHILNSSSYTNSHVSYLHKACYTFQIHSVNIRNIRCFHKHYPAVIQDEIIHIFLSEVVPWVMFLSMKQSYDGFWKWSI